MKKNRQKPYIREWISSEFAKLEKLYPTTSVQKIADMLGRTKSDVATKAKRHGMKKKNIRKSGRKKGSVKPPTEPFYMRVPKGMKAELRQVVKQYLESKNE